MKTNITSKFKAMTLPACAALALFASTASSEADIYLKYEGLDGNIKREDHKGWIAVESVVTPILRTSAVDPETEASGDLGDAVFGDMVIIKKIDKSTTKIMEAAAEGTQLAKEIEIHVCTSIRGKEVPYVIYKLKDVVVTSYKLHTNADDNTAYEEFTLNFTEIEWTTKDPKTGAVLNVVLGDGSVR